MINNIATEDPICSDNNGSITIQANAGEPPLQYSIDNGLTFQASNVFDNLVAGTYNIVVEDAAGCQATQQYVLGNNGGPTLDDINVEKCYLRRG